jgi:transcriptional regulator with XRE-family HTH domain
MRRRKRVNIRSNLDSRRGNNLKEAVGIAVCEARLGANLSQAELAEMCGLSQASVSAFELHGGTLMALQRISLALSVRPSTLLAKAEERFGLIV